VTTALAQDLRQQLLEELEWEPKLGTSQVDVQISDRGVVTLTVSSSRSRESRR
jgi:hypothetical protein